MTTLTMQSTRSDGGSGTGATETRQEQGRRRAARRLVLVFVLLGLLLVVAAAANYGPVRHYLDARARLDKAAAEVAALEERTADLQAQLGKLSESGYLEDLARQQLTYALPGEELYVVTAGAEGAAAGESAGAGEASIAAEASAAVSEAAAEVAAAVSGVAETASGVAEAASSGEATTVTEPGLLERILLAIASFF